MMVVLTKLHLFIPLSVICCTVSLLNEQQLRQAVQLIQLNHLFLFCCCCCSFGGWTLHDGRACTKLPLIIAL